MSYFKEQNGNLLLSIYVIPRSSRSEIVGIYNDCLKIKLKSPPVDNAANEELVRFLAEKLKVPKKNIEIVKGHKQKKKIVSISKCVPQQLQQLYHQSDRAHISGYQKKAALH